MRGALDIFGLGFIALIWGALAVQWSKWLEAGTRRKPRAEPNPYYKPVRWVGALMFLSGLAMIGWSAWMMMR